jgi:hypothetical protein
MCCAFGLIFGGIEGVGSRFCVLRFLISCQWYRGRRLWFSCNALPDSFSTVPFLAMPRAPGPIFILSLLDPFSAVPRAPSPVFILSLPNPFSAVPSVRGRVLIFCAPELIFGGTEGAGSRFHVLRSWTRLQRYQGRGVPFLCFALPNPFSMVLRTSSLIFIFCAPEHVFGVFEVVESHFHVLHPPGPVFGGTEGAESRFHVLRSMTRFRRYRGHQVLFSCFVLPLQFPCLALPNTFWAV